MGEEDVAEGCVTASAAEAYEMAELELDEAGVLEADDDEVEVLETDDDEAEEEEDEEEDVIEVSLDGVE